MKEKGFDWPASRAVIYIHQEWEMPSMGDLVNDLLRTRLTGMHHGDREKGVPSARPRALRRQTAKSSSLPPQVRTMQP